MRLIGCRSHLLSWDFHGRSVKRTSSARRQSRGLESRIVGLACPELRGTPGPRMERSLSAVPSDIKEPLGLRTTTAYLDALDFSVPPVCTIYSWYRRNSEFGEP